MFSKTCEYGIKAMIFIAAHSLEDQRLSLREIAAEIQSPAAFTAKILQQLVKSKLLYSVMGPTGGFQLDKERLKDIRLSHIVDVIDGDSIYKGCGLGLNECNEEQPCPVHHRFVSIRDELRLMLIQTSLFELATSLEVGRTFLKR